MFRQSGKNRHESIDEFLPKLTGWPIFERSEVYNQSNDGEVSIQARALIDSAFDDPHGTPKKNYVVIAGASGVLVSRLYEAPLIKTWSRTPRIQTGSWR